MYNCKDCHPETFFKGAVLTGIVTLILLSTIPFLGFVFAVMTGILAVIALATLIADRNRLGKYIERAGKDVEMWREQFDTERFASRNLREQKNRLTRELERACATVTRLTRRLRKLERQAITLTIDICKTR